YRLEGLDPDWLPPTAERVARYSHPPAGHYRFLLISSNNGGVWRQQAASLALNVIAPWWRTKWFAAGAMLAFAGVIAGTARLITVRRYRRRLAEIERAHALERERSRIARDMHD